MWSCVHCAWKSRTIGRCCEHRGLFPGAGISVSACLNTYRGAECIDTVATLDSHSPEPDEIGLCKSVTDRALVEMSWMGKIDYCVTQNCENLHQEAGFRRRHVSELRGNVNCASTQTTCGCGL